ncbi:MAG: uncharacterized protein KVP18_003369 [Porospora cf. gigantea A]|uniref:uncharacterized protein n=1 Tax=Porospora cf. gigantea A TaxID=2853593 RepID=UPI00355958AB|nr:MAG: hypothetical protein KVP18_003369 [Porospora cf. gigantea A]
MALVSLYVLGEMTALAPAEVESPGRVWEVLTKHLGSQWEVLTKHLGSQWEVLKQHLASQWEVLKQHLGSQWEVLKQHLGSQWEVLTYIQGDENTSRQRTPLLRGGTWLTRSRCWEPPPLTGDNLLRKL